MFATLCVGTSTVKFALKESSSNLSKAREEHALCQPGKSYGLFSPTAESFGVSAQIGSGVVRGGLEVRFHEGSTRVPPDFHEVLQGLRGGARALKRAPHAFGDIT